MTAFEDFVLNSSKVKTLMINELFREREQMQQQIDDLKQQLEDSKSQLQQNQLKLIAAERVIQRLTEQ